MLFVNDGYKLYQIGEQEVSTFHQKYPQAIIFKIEAINANELQMSVLDTKRNEWLVCQQVSITSTGNQQSQATKDTTGNPVFNATAALRNQYPKQELT